MRRASLGILIAAALGVATIASDVAADGSRGKKPRLDLRAAPRISFSPTNVLITAELMGGDAQDDLHCPELEWDFDDGSRSVRESDCEPLEAGAEFQRRFTAQHAYRRAGDYTVKIIMRHNSRQVAAASVTVTVRPGAGDMTSID